LGFLGFPSFVKLLDLSRDIVRCLEVIREIDVELEISAVISEREVVDKVNK